MKITQEVRDFPAKQNSESYLVSENIKRETSSQTAYEAREGMEQVSKVYRKSGELLYISDDNI